MHIFILGGLVEKGAYCKHLLMPPDLSEHSGSNIPQTGEFINNRNLFFIGLEAGKSKIKLQHGCSLVRAFFLHYQHLLTLPSHGRSGQRTPCRHILIRPLILFMRVPLSCPKHLPKAPCPNTITSGIRNSTYAFVGEHKHSDHNSYLNPSNLSFSIYKAEVL